MALFSMQVCIFVASAFFGSHDVPLSFYPCPWVDPVRCAYSALNPENTDHEIWADCRDKYGNRVYNGRVYQVRLI